MNKFYFLIFLISVHAGANVTQENSCVEEKKILFSEFIPIDFDHGRNIVGLDQVEPVKNKIKDFIRKETDAIVTDIQVVSHASKTPHYKLIKGKRKIDPDSDTRNFSLATERAAFVLKSIEDLKTQSSYKAVKFEVKSQLSGPDFTPRDLNDRFITKMSPGHKTKVKALFEENKKEFEETALIKSPDVLMKEKDFVNLYQAKFKPFLGFKLTIMGHKKSELKCIDSKNSPRESSKSSKQ